MLAINCKKLKILFLWIIAAFFICLTTTKISYNYSFTDYCAKITALLFFLLSIQFICLKYLLPKQRYILPITILLFYIFHLSHVVLNAIQYDFGVNERNNINFRFFDSICVEATSLILISSCFLFTGIVLYFIIVRNNITVPSSPKYRNYTTITFLLLSLGFLADAYYAYTAIMAQLMYGYNEVGLSLSTTSYLVRLTSYLLLPGIILIISSSSVQKKNKKIILILFCLYKILIMSSGLRAYSLINILLAIYIYIRYNVSLKRIKLTHLTLCLIGFHFLGGILVGIRDSRVTGISISSILDNVFSLNSNLLFNMMSEFGITQNVICEIINNLGSFTSNGSQLLTSFVIVVPFISYFFPEYNFNNNFLETNLSIHNYGGTFLGDIVFDFGSFYMMPICIFVGYFIAFATEKYEKLIINKSNFYVALLSPVFVEFIYCIRSSSAKMPRMISWYFIILFFVYLISRIKLKKE